METGQMQTTVREHCSVQELLLQLAEEGAELSHAALKLRRVIDGSNPTPVSLSEARHNLQEEIADVTLCLDVLQYDRPMVKGIMQKKLNRWVSRLSEVRKQ